MQITSYRRLTVPAVCALIAAVFIVVSLTAGPAVFLAFWIPALAFDLFFFRARLAQIRRCRRQYRGR